MFRNKDKNQYGTFAVRSKKLFRNKKIISSAVLVLLAVAVFGFLQIKKDDPVLVTEEPNIVDASLPGWWYADYFGSSICDQDDCKSDADPDRDKLTNAQEFYFRTNPINRDTNNNGLTDGEDVAQNYDPSKPGKVTFAEAESDDVFVGESLVFAEDIRKEFNQSLDINSVKLPEINEPELDITNDNSEEALIAYSQASYALIKEYFPDSRIGEISESLFTYNIQERDEIKLGAKEVYLGLKNLTVPSDFLAFHKYNILLFQLLPTVLTVPDDATLSDQYSHDANYWFDSTQQFLVVLQKLDLEAQVLGIKYP